METTRFWTSLHAVLLLFSRRGPSPGKFANSVELRLVTLPNFAILVALSSHSNVLLTRRLQVRGLSLDHPVGRVLLAWFNI